MRGETIQKVLSPKVFCLLVVVEVDCYSLNGLATVVLELNTWPKLSELINQWEARTGLGDQWQRLRGVTSATTFDCSESRAGNYQPWGTGGVSGCLSWNKNKDTEEKVKTFLNMTCMTLVQGLEPCVLMYLIHSNKHFKSSWEQLCIAEIRSSRAASSKLNTKHPR